MTEYVFYVYDDNPDDPRFSFWMQHPERGIETPLFGRPPDGEGKWLDPEMGGSDYAGTDASNGLRVALADLIEYKEVKTERVEELPAHESAFVRYITGTIEEHPGSLPAPVWDFMHECHREKYDDAE